MSDFAPEMRNRQDSGRSEVADDNLIQICREHRANQWAKRVRGTALAMAL